MQTYVSDLSQESEDVVLDMFNYQNQKHVNRTNVRLSKAKTVVDTGNGNTTIVLTATRPTDINGTARHYYNRVDLSSYLSDEILGLPRIDYNSIGDILEAVSMHHGINISAREVYPIKIPTDFLNGNAPLELRINVMNSVLYKGSFQVRVDYVSLASRIRNNMLNGFYPPREEL